VLNTAVENNTSQLDAKRVLLQAVCIQWGP
jgi:hypothetical protein